MRLMADSKASPDARGAVTGDKELSSNDPARACGEAFGRRKILIGY